MTRSVIPTFVAAGVRAISVGVNDASAPPGVPNLFNWSHPESGTSVIAMYHPGGYGWSIGSPINVTNDCITPPGMPSSLCFAFKGDNRGPPNATEVLSAFSTLQAAFPGMALCCHANAGKNLVQYDPHGVPNLLGPG